MILTCPACGTRYRVDQQELRRPAGRTVRCASCGHTWHQAPAVPETGGREPAAISPAPRIEPGLELPARPRPVPLPAVQHSQRRRFSLGWVVLIVLILLLVVAVLIGFAARGRVVAMWPAAARLYALAGLPVERPGAGLELGKIIPARTPDGLIIEGDIANGTGTARDVPRLRVALRDNAEKEVQFKIIDPPKARLAPGEVAHFKTPFDHPEDSATGVVVTFTPR